MQFSGSGFKKLSVSKLLPGRTDVAEYSAGLHNHWNRFISKAKNSNFQHRREYMEYHKDRFEDNSLIFMKDNNAECLFPANLRDNTLYSHEGITFGGFLIGASVKQKEVLHMFDCLLAYAQLKGIENIVIKPQPHIYNRYLSEEILYALFKNNAVLTGRAISSVINLNEQLPYSKGRKWSLKKALQHDISMSESKDFDGFIELETTLLKNKYAAVPVHTAKELKYLNSVYPDKIKLYTVNHNDEMIGGVILFLMGQVIKCQYICSNDLCKELHALDYLFTELIKKYRHEFQYFDFGHSTLNSGRYLEDTLIQNKESYGARGVCYDAYSIKL
jgi:hypothetical protein